MLLELKRFTGGSFTHRTEVVKTKSKVATVDRRNALLIAWFTCALSKVCPPYLLAIRCSLTSLTGPQQELKEPLVADALGKIYNKDALIEFLLAPASTPDTPVSSRPFGADGLLAAGHLRSLKDVQDLKLTPASSTGQLSVASAINAGNGGQIEYGKARWECPITMRGMNGSVKFVYVKGCGCVASEVGLRELAGVTTHSPKEQENEGHKEPSKAICPVCSRQLLGLKVEMVTLNPTGQEKEKMALAWAEKVAADAQAKADKKASKKKKRKEPAEGEDDSTAKKVKLNSAPDQPAPAINRKLPSLPELKKPMSAAVASLYASKKDDASKLSPFFSGSYSRMG